MEADAPGEIVAGEALAQVRLHVRHERREALRRPVRPFRARRRARVPPRIHQYLEKSGGSPQNGERATKRRRLAKRGLQRGKRLGVGAPKSPERHDGRQWEGVEQVGSERRGESRGEGHPLVDARFGRALAEGNAGGMHHHASRRRGKSDSPARRDDIAFYHMAHRPERIDQLDEIQGGVRRRLHLGQFQTKRGVQGSVGSGHRLSGYRIVKILESEPAFSPSKTMLEQETHA